jgi:hypothetical protein
LASEEKKTLMPAVVVFRLRARYWLLMGFISLLIALSALYGEISPVSSRTP